jgi:hypothetical protein
MKGLFGWKKAAAHRVRTGVAFPRQGRKGRARREASRPSLPRAAAEIAICVLLVAGQGVFFSRHHPTGLWLPLVSVLPGVCLGLLWHLFAGPEKALHAWLSRRLARVLAGFGLFFFHLVFYLLLFSLTVSYPLGWLIGMFSGSMDLAREYMVYSVSPVFLLAAGSWFRWWRTARRRGFPAS